MTNLADNLIRSALCHPARPAVRLDEIVLSYGDLNDLACRAAGWLAQRGVQPGDRVGLMLPNVLAFPVLYYGILRAGGIVVPMNPLLKDREVEHCLGDSGARLAWVCPTAADEASRGAGLAEIVTVGETFLSDAALWPPLREVCDRDEHDTAAILYTSGTTGRPKGAELTHASLGGGAALPEEVLQNFADTFGAQILEGYGLSETAPVASSNHRGRARAGSIGHPIEGVQMRVVDPRPSCSSPAPRQPPTSFESTSRHEWRPTSTHATSGCSTRCRRARPARSSSAKSRLETLSI